MEIYRIYTVYTGKRNALLYREIHFVCMFYSINGMYVIVMHTHCLLMQYKPAQRWWSHSCALHVLLQAVKFLKSKLSGESGLLEPKIGIAAGEVSDTGLGLAFSFFPSVSYLRKCQVFGMNLEGEMSDLRWRFILSSTAEGQKSNTALKLRKVSAVNYGR